MFTYFTYLFLFFIFFHCFSITVALIFPRYSPLPGPSPHALSHSPPCPSCPWVIYTCSLTTPSLFCPPLSSPSSLGLLSVHSLFPCLSSYFAHLFVLLICLSIFYYFPFVFFMNCIFVSYSCLIFLARPDTWRQQSWKREKLKRQTKEMRVSPPPGS